MVGGESYPLRVRSGDEPDGAPDYALLDAGDGRRLERFGGLIVDRPAPGATEPRRAPDRWREAELRYDPLAGWSGRPALPSPWTVMIAGLAMELRPASSGGVGLYPEHAANVPWLAAAVQAHVRPDRRPSVLNLFAHTGLATLAAARAGAAVAHVDAARSSVAWARRNAELGGLADRPIRWLVDDAPAFTEREARRHRRYDGIVLDPPSAGHGRTGHGRAGRWTLDEHLPRLLEACARVGTDDAFVLLTAHTTGLTGEALAESLRSAFPGGTGRCDLAALTLTAESGASLRLGWAVRLEPAGAATGDAVPARNGAP